MKPEVSYPRIMAIVNVTDDSFYSASRTMERSGIASRVEKAIADGASVIDVGGYSSRPGASDIPVGEEWRRVDAGIAAVSAQCFDNDLIERIADRQNAFAEQILHFRRNFIVSVIDIRIFIFFLYSGNFK